MLHSGGGSNSSKQSASSKSMKRLTRFVVAEVCLLVLLLTEWAFTLWAQEKERLSLRTDSDLVFAMKVMARSTEWLMIAVLVAVCCVKKKKPKDGGAPSSQLGSATPSQNFMMVTFRRLASSRSSEAAHGQRASALEVSVSSGFHDNMYTKRSDFTMRRD